MLSAVSQLKQVLVRAQLQSLLASLYYARAKFDNTCPYRIDLPRSTRRLLGVSPARVLPDHRPSITGEHFFPNAFVDQQLLKKLSALRNQTRLVWIEGQP